MFKWPGTTTGLFIDGANTHSAAKELGFMVDWKKVHTMLDNHYNLVCCKYYTAYRKDEDGHISIYDLMNWLSFNGYIVVSKEAKEYSVNDQRKIKGNMDCEMIVDVLEISTHIDHAVLFTGDGDFTILVQALQRKAVRVTVVSTMKTNTPFIADSLRRQANDFIDLADLRSHFEQAHVAKG